MKLGRACEGLDTYADVTLNGKKILSADNMFCEWQVDVRSLLKEHGNELQVTKHAKHLGNPALQRDI